MHKTDQTAKQEKVPSDLWSQIVNSLPDNVRTVNNTDNFKNLLKGEYLKYAFSVSKVLFSL